MHPPEPYSLPPWIESPVLSLLSVPWAGSNQMRLLPQESFPPLHFPPPRLFFNLSHAERGWLVCNFVLHIRPFPLRSSPNSIRSNLSWALYQYKKPPQGRFFVLVIPTRFELVSPPWKGGVLTIRRWDRQGFSAAICQKTNECIYANIVQVKTYF